MWRYGVTRETNNQRSTSLSPSRQRRPPSLYTTIPPALHPQRSTLAAREREGRITNLATMITSSAVPARTGYAHNSGHAARVSRNRCCSARYPVAPANSTRHRPTRFNTMPDSTGPRCIPWRTQAMNKVVSRCSDQALQYTVATMRQLL